MTPQSSGIVTVSSGPVWYTGDQSPARVLISEYSSAVEF